MSIRRVSSLGIQPTFTAVNKSFFSRPATIPCELLVVGGGGPGKSGGGGAGGLLYYGTEAGVTGSGGIKNPNGPSMSFKTGIKYTITIGIGGVGGTLTKGTDTTISSEERTIIAYAGGASQNTDQSGPFTHQTGGSGGGGGRSSTANPQYGGSGIPGQGTPGGTCTVIAFPYPGAGGGGAAQNGNSEASGSVSGAGGFGVGYYISGSLVYYAGGGGGGGGDNGAGAAPAVGYATTAGSNGGNTAESGGANTGSGGGGHAQGGNLGGSGGSGIVIIRHADTFPLATTTGTVTVTPSSGGYRTYRFTGDGSITF